MRVGISAFFLKYPISGIGQYSIHLLKALGAVDPQNEYALLGPRSIIEQSNILKVFPCQMRSVDRFVPSFVSSLVSSNEQIEKLLWEQAFGPALALKAGVDVFHVPYFAPPVFSRTPMVVTIHDGLQFQLPAYQSSGKRRAYLRFIGRAAHKAARIITVSHHARQDIIDVLHIAPERVRVIYEAAGDEYRPVTNPDMLAKTRARYGVGDCYVFYLGGHDRRKNVSQLVRSFAHLFHRLGNPDLQLFISGDPDRQRGPLFRDPRQVAAAVGVTDNVIFRFVKDEDKPAIYSGARLFAFPSLYEGFGLPPLEAMCCGAPVICSNRTSLPEVVGDAALSIDPDDTTAFAGAMYDILTNDALRADLQARSLRRASLFSWQKAATETLAVYQEAIADSKHERHHFFRKDDVWQRNQCV